MFFCIFKANILKIKTKSHNNYKIFLLRNGSLWWLNHKSPHFKLVYDPCHVVVKVKSMQHMPCTKNLKNLANKHNETTSKKVRPTRYILCNSVQ